MTQDRASGRFDLVVGADGLHSALRAMVFGPHERFLRHLGHVLAFYFASADFDVDYRDVAAQKVLLRERMAGLGWLTPDILAYLDDTRTSTSTRSPRW